MAEEKEILRYELDLADVEAKAQRLRILTEQMRAATAKGENTEELQQQIQGEVNALASMGAEQKKAASTTEELIRQKEKLTSVVGLLGGSFGGTVGQIANMIGMLVAANPAIAGVAAGLAALTVGIQIFKSIQDEAKKATEEQERYNAAVAKGQELRGQVAAGVADRLASWGRRTPESVRSGLELQQRLGENWGVPESDATKVAALAAGAGMGEEDAAVLRVLIAQGANIETPEQAQRAIAELRRSGKHGAALGLAHQWASDQVGTAERVRASAPGRVTQPEMRPEQAAYAALQAQPGGLAASGLPADMTFDQFRDVVLARERMDELERSGVVRRRGNKIIGGSGGKEWLRLQKLDEQYGWVPQYIEQVAVQQAGQGAGGGGELFNPQSQLVSGMDLARLAMGLAPQAEGDLGAQVRGAVQVINNTGTVIQLDTNRKIRTPGRPQMGGSDGDILTPY